MNRKPNAPKCILGVVMVVLLVVGGLATTTARFSTTKANTTIRAGVASVVSPQSPCGPTIPPALCNVFEIEGNAADDSGFPGLPEDWNDVVSSVETNAVPPQGFISGAPTTASVASTRTFINDLGAADQIFTQGGSKDFNDISDWRHTTGSVPDKDEITHGGAAKYNDSITGHEVLTFFADRFDNSGDANIGFWFFKNPISVNANGTFSGLHSIGDIFIISAFTKGGGTSTIQVFKWVGTQAATECLAPAIIDPKSDTNQFPDGSLCNITAVPSGGISAGSGIVNGGAITVNWPYTQKGGAACNSGPCSIPQKGLFFEGGIDLTAVGLGGSCFSSFLLETRSSAEVSAVLKDFALGNFEQCALTCSKSANPTTVCSGDSTTYSYSVTNPGGLPLTVTVTDDNGTPGNAADDFSPFDASGNCADSAAGTSFTLAAHATKTCNRPVTNLQATVTNSIHVVGTSAGGTQLTCDSSATVTVNPRPGAPTTQGASRCGPGIVQLSAGGCTGTLTWYDAPSGGNIVATGTSFSPNLASTQTFYVSCTSAAGCEGPRTSVTGTINPIPGAPTTTPDARCGAGVVNLSAGGCTGTLTWYDAPSGGNVVNTGASFGPSLTTTTTYYVSCTNAFGCEGPRTSVTGTINPVPTVEITANGCLTSNTLTATVTGGTANFTYHWTGPGGLDVTHGPTASTTDALTDVTTPGSYTVVVTDANTCGNSRNGTVGVCLVSTQAASAASTQVRAPKAKKRNR